MLWWWVGPIIMFQRLKCIISRVLVMFFLGLYGPVLCLLNYFHEVSPQLSSSLSFGRCFILSSPGRQSMRNDWVVFFSLCFLVPSFSVSYMETNVVEYTIKINFICDNTFLAVQIPREGLLSLLFFIVNDSKKLMRLVILGAWSNLFLLVSGRWWLGNECGGSDNSQSQ